MTNKFADFLKLLSPQEQLREIEFWINELNKSNKVGEVIAKKIRMLGELKALKKEIISNPRGACIKEQSLHCY